ncbi:MAG: NHL repeat-containing protein [bacterium]|nr:MAG: NHL repeat-containing protein [bacterium]
MKLYKSLTQILFILLCSALSFWVLAQDTEPAAKWRISTVIDGMDTPTGAFLNITAIDLDSEGNLYILDGGRNRLLKYSGNGQLMKEIGGFGSSQDRFNDPRDLDAHLTLNIYVADYNNDRIVLLDTHLNYLNEFKSLSDDLFFFEMPLSVAVNNQYDLFILEDLNKRIVKYDRFNQPSAQFGKASENLGQLLGPAQVAMGSKNELFISDPIAKSVIVFDYLGNFLNEISHPDFIEPRGIDVSLQEQLLIADQKGKKVYFYKTNGKLLDILDLAPYNIVPTDISLWQPRGSRHSQLYLSSVEKCYLLVRE